MDEERDARRRWMAVLARAPRDELERLWEAVADKPDLAPLKPAETGLVMVRARTGGSGAPFNLGEMTVTRCVLQAPGHELGHGYVAGRDLRLPSSRRPSTRCCNLHPGARNCLHR